MGKQFENLTGQKFGHYTVIKRDKSKKVSYWFCQCDCGNLNLVSVHTSALKNGQSWHCGCVNNHDLTGKRFGKLTALNRDNTKSGIYWVCKCDCENKTIKSILSYSLLNGSTKSCGCLVKEMAKNTHKKYNRYDLSGEYGIGYDSDENDFLF